MAGFLHLTRAMEGRLWSVVLAAGLGRRLAGVTGGTPKQFWRPPHRRSLLEQTLDRLGPLGAVERTVVVVADAQRDFVRSWPARRRGQLAFQPEDRGTAAGILFGVLPILAEDPDAIVVISPSDHGVDDERLFRRGILQGVTQARNTGGIVLFGVEPSSACVDYGWMTLGSKDRGGSIRPALSFIEKPNADAARRLLAAGAIWNTMVLVARVQELLGLFRSRLPALTSALVHSLNAPPDVRGAFLRSSYTTLGTSDFSRDVLARSRRLLAYTWPSSLGWSDLGTPDRLHAWLGAPPRDQRFTQKPIVSGWNDTEGRTPRHATGFGAFRPRRRSASGGPSLESHLVMRPGQAHPHLSATPPNPAKRIQ